jgi:hypothetical protein
MNKELQRMEPSEGSLASRDAQPMQELNIAVIADRVMAGEMTNEKLSLIERLVAMDAERKFAAAFVSLQSEMPKVQAKTPVPNNDGTVRYRFAAFEDIMDQVQPLLLKYGFTVTFSSRFENARVIQTCTLQHAGGHKRMNEFAVRVGSGPPKASEAQADGAASTYAKRFALTDALNIVIEKDSDARLEGGQVTQEQADELERRLKMINGDVGAFLKLAGAKTFAEISSVKYDILDQFLQMKERRR